MDIAAIIDLSDITITEVTKNEMEHLLITVRDNRVLNSVLQMWEKIKKTSRK